MIIKTEAKIETKIRNFCKMAEQPEGGITVTIRMVPQSWLPGTTPKAIGYWQLEKINAYYIFTPKTFTEKNKTVQHSGLIPRAFGESGAVGIQRGEKHQECHTWPGPLGSSVLPRLASWHPKGRPGVSAPFADNPTIPMLWTDPSDKGSTSPSVSSTRKIFICFGDQRTVHKGSNEISTNIQRELLSVQKPMVDNLGTSRHCNQKGHQQNQSQTGRQMK